MTCYDLKFPFDNEREPARTALINALITEMQRSPLATIKQKTLCAIAGVDPRTMRNHFKSVDQVLTDYLGTQIELLDRQLRNGQQATGLEAHKIFARILRENADVVQAMIDQGLWLMIVELVEKLAMKLLKAIIDHAVKLKQDFVYFALGGITKLVIQWQQRECLDDDQFVSARLHDIVSRFFLSGVF